MAFICYLLLELFLIMDFVNFFLDASFWFLICSKEILFCLLLSTILTITFCLYMIDAQCWYKFLSFAYMLNLSFVYCFSICQGIPISAFCPTASTCVIKVDKHSHQIVQKISCIGNLLLFYSPFKIFHIRLSILHIKILIFLDFLNYFFFFTQ